MAASLEYKLESFLATMQGMKASQRIVRYERKATVQPRKSINTTQEGLGTTMEACQKSHNKGQRRKDGFPGKCH
jgi:hypothetical protein